jgi:predicted RNA-binding Zn-ribbon protein involved in translation (DUF1610 family)
MIHSSYGTLLGTWIDGSNSWASKNDYQIALRWWFRFLWLGLMTIGVLAEIWRPHSLLSYYLRMSVLTLLGVSMIGAFAFGFVCPRCRSNLLRNGGAILSGHSFACPKCRVSLDDSAKSHNKQT